MGGRPSKNNSFSRYEEITSALTNLNKAVLTEARPLWAGCGNKYLTSIILPSLSTQGLAIFIFILQMRKLLHWDWLRSASESIVKFSGIVRTSC